MRASARYSEETMSDDAGLYNDATKCERNAKKNSRLRSQDGRAHKQFFFTRAVCVSFTIRFDEIVEMCCYKFYVSIFTVFPVSPVSPLPPVPVDTPALVAPALTVIPPWLVPGA